MFSGTARRSSIFLAVVAAVALGLAIGNPTAGAADGEIVLDVRVGTAGPQLALAESACAEIQIGQVFLVDVRVENVDDLIAFELSISYDGTILAMESANFEHFLVSTSPNGQIFPSLFEPESADSYFLAAANTQGSPDSGSGVLARLEMRAIGEGTSEISIQTDPTVFGPRLLDKTGKAIGDDTGDLIFDGTVLSGTAAVHRNCLDTGGSEDPPLGETDADDGAEPGGGNDAGAGDGPATGAEDGTAGSGNGPGDGVIGGGSQNENPADVASARDSGSGGDSASADDDSAKDGTDADDGRPLDEASNATDSDGGSSLGLWWYMLIALGAAAVLATLGLMIKATRAP